MANNRVFRECAACADKTGSPRLCGSCLHNRELVSHLNEVISTQAMLLTHARNAGDADSEGGGRPAARATEDIPAGASGVISGNAFSVDRPFDPIAAGSIRRVSLDLAATNVELENVKRALAALESMVLGLKARQTAIDDWNRAAAAASNRNRER